MSKPEFAKNIIDNSKGMPRPPGITKEEIKRREENVKFPIYVDDAVIPGSYYFMAAWWKQITGKGSPAEEHDHEFDEYLVFLGTDPDNPNDLCGEVELWIGGEKHTLTKSCAVFVPAGVKHAPIYFRRVDKPIWYLATGPTEKYKKELSVKEKK
jgi:mannose-6-phosphate isomerase-like protein (cupin superfamily)